MPDLLTEVVAALRSGDADRLDAVQDDTLLLQAIAVCERAHSEGLPEAAARALDTAYAVRLLDLAQPGTQAAEAQQFANHLYRVAHDKRRIQLDAMEPRFFSRWRGYADVAVLLMRLRRHERQQAQSTQAPESWEQVAEAIRTAGPDGLAWSALFERYCQLLGGRSKGALTQLLGRMRDAGWVRTVKTGRNVRVFLGPQAPVALNDASSAAAVGQLLQKANPSAPSNEPVRSLFCPQPTPGSVAGTA